MDIYARLAALKEAYRGEALFRPSGIGRVIACPGSVALAAKAPKERRRSKWATEGSAAHVVAEQALRGERMPWEWTDRMVQLDSGGMEGEFVDQEMSESVEFYMDVVKEYAGGLDVLVEQQVSLGPLDPANPIFAENRGTADAVVMDHKNGVLTIVDLKYGRGVPVAGDSPQLLDYGIASMLSFPGDWRLVRTVVVQPRLPDERQRRKAFDHYPADLSMDFLGKLVEAMHAALADDPPLRTGAHCRWCRAKDAGICPAIQSEAFAVGRDTFMSMPPLTAASSMPPIPATVTIGPVSGESGSVSLPAAETLDPADIATILDRLDLFEVWAESVRHRAARFIEAGVSVPGWMLSARLGHRRWKEKQEETQAALQAIGLKIGEMYEPPTLLSPARIEKLLPRERKGLIEPLVERPTGQPVLMRAKEGRISAAKPMGAIEG